MLKRDPLSKISAKHHCQNSPSPLNFPYQNRPSCPHPCPLSERRRENISAAHQTTEPEFSLSHKGGTNVPDGTHPMAETLDFEATDVVRIILQFCKENGLSQSYAAIEQECQISLNTVDNIAAFVTEIQEGPVGRRSTFGSTPRNSTA